MRLILTPLALIFILFQFSPFGGSPEEKPEEKPPVKGWWVVSHFAVPQTRYSKLAGGVIKAESRGTRSSLFRKTSEKERDFSVLSWRWKISNVVRSAIETRDDRYDTSARVIIVFGKASPWGAIEGGNPPGVRIEYIWASRLPKGKRFDHSGEKNTKVIVLESGDEKAGRWVAESRNVRKDYKELFQADPLPVLAIGIETDTDQSNEMVTAYYSEPVLRKR